MANYLTTPGFTKGQAAHLAKGVMRTSLVDVTLDFAQIVAARAAAGVAALAATDTLQVLPLPKGSVILSAGVEVISAETANTTATFSLGFVGGTPAAANAFANALASNALGAAAVGVVPTFVNGTTDNTTNLAVTLVTAAPTNAVIRVFALVADVSGV